MKTEANESGARNEYFDQLTEVVADFFTSLKGEEEAKLKERILSISFDRVQELERRVEELEAALEQAISRINPKSKDTWDLKALYVAKTALNKNHESNHR